jgi:hypothetical protein
MSKTKHKPKSKKANVNDPAQFPGYPPYPEREDITLQGKRIPMNDEGIAVNPRDVAQPNTNAPEDIASGPDELDGVSESDVTQEDLEALGPRDLSLDMGEDEELLKHRTRPVDFGGEDLDVPGAELDDENEAIGEEDEENNSYSLGGDRHDDTEARD